MNRALNLITAIFELAADVNTFTHEGHQYDLSKLNALIKAYPVQTFKTKDLDWIFKYDDPTKDGPERIKTAWLSLPIIVINWKGKLVVLDGLHRLKKAELAGEDTIRGRMVTMDDLNKVLVK